MMSEEQKNLPTTNDGEGKPGGCCGGHGKNKGEGQGHGSGHGHGHGGGHGKGAGHGHGGGHGHGHGGGHGKGHGGGHPGGHPGGKPGSGYQGHGQDPAKLDPRDTVVDRDEVNARTNYSLHATFKTIRPLPSDATKRAELAQQVIDATADTGGRIRGWYDVSGFRADADLMYWVLADTTDQIQDFNRALTNNELGTYLKPVWNIMSAHMVAEFSPYHLPACFDGVGPRPYMAVYPFIRSYDWYYIHPDKRADILKRHGMNGLDHLDVKISTLASFGISDYEWSISLEHDNIERIMSVLRKQRDAEARLYTREDIPMYTGKRMDLAEWVELQPRM